MKGLRGRGLKQAVVALRRDFATAEADKEFIGADRFDHAVSDQHTVDAAVLVGDRDEFFPHRKRVVVAFAGNEIEDLLVNRGGRLAGNQFRAHCVLRGDGRAAIVAGVVA